MHVDERHHHTIRARQTGVLVAERQRGFVAVMPVGDQQFLVRHQLLDDAAHGIGHPPHAVDRAVLVRDLRYRRQRRRLIQQRVDGAFGIGIQHEDLPAVRVRVAQQLEPVLLRPRERLLVPVHHAGGVVLHRAQGDEPLAHQALARVGDGEFLEVRVDASVAVLRQHPAGDPVVQVARGTGVDVVAVGILGFALPQDHAHQVVRAERQVAAPHRRGNLVVRLRYEVSQGTGLFRVPERLECIDFCQILRYQLAAHLCPTASRLGKWPARRRAPRESGPARVPPRRSWPARCPPGSLSALSPIRSAG